MRAMRFAVVRFPGTWSDRDCRRALVDVLGQRADIVWHRETSLAGYDAIVLPGGFSYGDYLRCGAIARFSPVMEAVGRAAATGVPVIGICNGFQILCESGLLPGALMRNRGLRFRCEWTRLRVDGGGSPWTAGIAPGEVLRIPISHGEGSYQADPATLDALEREGRVLFRYCDERGEPAPAANPNGSARNIAGVRDRAGNVVGLMPHPERAAEDLLGGADGNRIWQSVIDTAAEAAA